VGKVQQEANEVGLTVSSRLAEEVFELIADGSYGNATKGSDLLQRIAGEEAVGDFCFSGSEAVVGAHQVVAQISWFFGVCHEQ